MTEPTYTCEITIEVYERNYSDAMRVAHRSMVRGWQLTQKDIKLCFVKTCHDPRRKDSIYCDEHTLMYRTQGL